jgi:hypothetical protein
LTNGIPIVGEFNAEAPGSYTVVAKSKVNAVLPALQQAFQQILK